MERFKKGSIRFGLSGVSWVPTAQQKLLFKLSESQYQRGLQACGHWSRFLVKHTNSLACTPHSRQNNNKLSTQTGFWQGDATRPSIRSQARSIRLAQD